MVTSLELMRLEDRFGAHNYHPLEVVLSRGEGVWVWDQEGRRYLDCLSAYSAVNQGHCHPRIRDALIQQASRLTLTSRAFHNDQLPLFCEEICTLTGYDRVLPMNSGAEAVETAIKTVRKWGYEVKGVPEDRAEIIVFANNFHGRTLSIVSFSTNPLARRHFGPYTPGFHVVPFGDLNAVRNAISANTVAVLAEPIQGEAGVIIPPDDFLPGLRALCTEQQVLLVLDEIQTGLGRTGTLLAVHHSGIRADATLVGKALSGGFYPVSAMLASDEVMGVLKPGEHGSTFGGNPLACAVAREALKVLVEEGMIDNAAVQGRRLLAGLARLNNPHIKEVRGRGLMAAIELHPGPFTARDLASRLKAVGVLAKDTHDFTLRLAPPLVITEEQVDWLLDRLTAVFAVGAGLPVMAAGPRKIVA